MFLAILASGLFSGAAIYINAVEHPARMACGARAALAQWSPSYRRATVMQASLAVSTGAFALGAWLLGASTWFLLAGGLQVLVAPYTFLVVMPTNKRLQALGRDANDSVIASLLARWNALHAVRSVMGLVAFALMLGVALMRG